MKQFVVDNCSWLFCIALILHNLEEALFLPAWSHSHHALVPISSIPFAATVIVITALAIILVLFKEHSNMERLLVGYAGALFLNVFIPHLIGSIILGERLPGLLTALLLIVPSSVAILLKATRENGATQIVKATAVMTVALLITIPVTYTVAGFLFR